MLFTGHQLVALLAGVALVAACRTRMAALTPTEPGRPKTPRPQPKEPVPTEACAHPFQFVPPQNTSMRLQAELALYGSPTQAALGLALPKHQRSNLARILIVNAAQKRVLERRIDEIIDYRLDKTFRPLLFWPLAITELPWSIVAITNEDSQFLAGTLTHAHWQHRFQGKTVLASTAVRAAGPFEPLYPAATLVAPGSTELLPQNEEPIEITREIAFAPNPLLKHAHITDPVGNLLSSHGEDFTDFLNHTYVFAYFPLSPTTVLRRLLRLG